MKVEELGEIGLIERISKKFLVNEKIIKVGAGEDDCAVIDIGSEIFLVVTTDMLQESTHFPHGISPFQIGWSLVAVNLSDIAAMGAHSFALTIAMGLPENKDIEFVDGIIEGIESCASCYRTYVVGGSTVKSKELILGGTCFGFAQRNKVTMRVGAKVGDLVCVTGSLGNAALGMKIIKEGLKMPKSIEEIAKKALFQPEPRLNEGIFLASTGVVTSMMDISDGLALSLAEIGKRSGVGFEIYEEKVPVPVQRKDEMKSLSDLYVDINIEDISFYYGGDYELLFTIDAEALEDEELLKKMKKEAKMSIIGNVVPPEDGIYLKKGEKREKIEIRGYQHF